MCIRDSPDRVRSSSFNNDGSLVAGLADGYARVTTHDPENLYEPAHYQMRHQAQLLSVATSSQNRVIFTAQTDNLIRRWIRGRRHRTVEMVYEIPWNAGYIAAHSRDRKYIAPAGPSVSYGSNSNVQVFDRDGVAVSDVLNVGGWNHFVEFEPGTRKLLSLIHI